ncbi:hypothetical protein J2790_002472 [Paenarthrobacter nicotinovorans]|nr:hypothetical protein [Paenarthrobacter nicotinovorans]SCZ53673.1 hypothetical protein SAMN02799638_01286 [Arthrobacter sp. UNCCL28]
MTFRYLRVLATNFSPDTPPDNLVRIPGHTTADRTQRPCRTNGVTHGSKIRP